MSVPTAREENSVPRTGWRQLRRNQELLSQYGKPRGPKLTTGLVNHPEKAREEEKSPDRGKKRTQKC
jgi:hypothetical protein